MDPNQIKQQGWSKGVSSEVDLLIKNMKWIFPQQSFGMWC